MNCSLFIRDGIAYIPTTAKTEAGYYMEIEPVEVAPISDENAFSIAVKQAIARGNPVIWTPTRATGFPKPFLHKYAKFKSWRAFERGASFWTFTEKDGSYQIEQWQQRPQGGWLGDPKRKEILPAGTSVDEAIRRLVERVKTSVN